MTTGNKYYTPDISEFIQGFKFEVLIEHSSKFGLLDFSNGSFKEISNYQSEDWYEKIVDWKYPKDEEITCTAYGVSITGSGEVHNFFSQYDDNKIIKLIQDGKIRCKK